jgi:class 3 adenylate cyclase
MDGGGPTPSALGESLDELIDRAVAAINRGDHAEAATLAGQVLTVDRSNADAADLLEAPSDAGEIRRLTILFTDLVDSTLLSTRLEPEEYRVVVGRYRDQVRQIVDRFEGHIGSTAGDGLLAVFGYPRAHEDDARRAVAAALQITQAVAALSEGARRRFGIDVAVRVGVHRGVVYLDTTQRDVYGLAANLTARVAGLAPPNSVVVSDTVAPLVRNAFELNDLPPASVKGVDELIGHHLVVAERSTPTRLAHGPLIGRERELSRLQDTWTRAVAGTLSTPGLVFQGEAGIGKSRLAAEAVAMADGSPVLELTGSPFHTDVGLHPLRTLLQHRCGIHRETDSTERIRLLENHIIELGLDPVSFVPLLAPVVGVGSEAGYLPVEAEGHRLYELIGQAVRDYLLACIGDRTALIVAEDVHWFDAATKEIVGSLLTTANGRLLLVLTARPGDWMPDDWPVTPVELEPLDEDDAAEMAGAVNPALSAEQRAAVVARCDGVPFFIEQVAAGSSERGVPEALYEPLFARLRADASVVPVIEAAAVIGRHIDRKILCEILDFEESRIDRTIGELEDALVFEPWGPGVWRFRHELLGEIAATLAPPSVQRTLHTRVAKALVCGSDPDWHVIARHYELAERFADAADAYERAAADAFRRGALGEGRTGLTMAIEQLGHAQAGPDRDRQEIRLRLQRGCMPTTPDVYQSGVQGTDFERCLALGGSSLGEDELRATVTPLVMYFAVRGDLSRALQVFESLGTGLVHGSATFARVVDGTYGVVAWLRGEFGQAHSRLESVVSQLTDIDQGEVDSLWYLPNEPRAIGFGFLALSELLRGDVGGADAAMESAKDWIGQLGFPQGPYSRGNALFLQSWICVESGRLDRAKELADEVVQLAQRHGFDAWLVVGATQLAAVTALAADPSALAGHIEAMTNLLNVWRTIGLRIYLPMYDAILARLQLRSGDIEGARARLDTGLQMAEETGLHFYNAELTRVRAHTKTDRDARQSDIASALALAIRQGATLFELRAAADDFQLRGAPARAALVDVLGRIPSDSTLPEVARAKTLLANG